MAVDYNDKRLTAVTEEEKTELAKSDKTYDSMINQTDAKYNGLINNSKAWADKQTQLQQEKTDFAIEKIEQQKEQTKKDYIKEQSGAYVDWQKQSNQYGANAEKMAAQGMAGTGYSESSQVAMYTAYQNRVASARDSFERAKLNYDNAITEARMQNNSILAEIAYKAQQEQLELSIKSFEYKNDLIKEKAATARQIKSFYNTKYNDVLDQINAEEALRIQEEQQKAAKEYQQAQLKIQKEELDLKKKQVNASLAGVVAGAAKVAKKTSSSKAKASTKTAYEKNKNGKVSSKAPKGFTGKTYDEANAYLKKNGVSGYNLMTRGEWSRRKSSYKVTGVGGTAVSANSTYADYLATAVAHAISQYK